MRSTDLCPDGGTEGHMAASKEAQLCSKSLGHRDQKMRRSEQVQAYLKGMRCLIKSPHLKPPPPPPSIGNKYTTALKCSPPAELHYRLIIRLLFYRGIPLPNIPWNPQPSPLRAIFYGSMAPAPSVTSTES